MDDFGFDSSPSLVTPGQLDLDRALLSAMLLRGAEGYNKWLDLGGTDTKLVGEASEAYKFITSYYQQYASTPSLQVVAAETEMALYENPGAPLEYFADKVNTRATFFILRQGLAESLKSLEKGTDDGIASARKAIDDLYLKLSVEAASSRNVQSMFHLAPEVKAHYERLERGEQGIQTPWPTINNMLRGFWPEELILFVARMGVGKTFTSLLLAIHAWKTGKRVLFCTTEMSKERIAMRFFTMLGRAPYGDFNHGTLSQEKKEEFFKFMDSLYNAEGMGVVGGGFDFKVETLKRSIKEFKPDLLIFDGAYLLQSEGANRQERMANAFNELKLLTMTEKLCIVITHQFNREVKKNVAATVSENAIALSDAGGWNASNIFALQQTDEMRTDKQLEISSLKVRDGSPVKFMVRWDFDAMDFTELESDGGGGGDADEHGSSFTPADDIPF